MSQQYSKDKDPEKVADSKAPNRADQFASNQGKPTARIGSDHFRATAVTVLVLSALYFTSRTVSIWIDRSHHAYYGSRVLSGPQWKKCEGLGKEYQCTSLAVPLDYRNASDKRTIDIALARVPAYDQKSRKGAVFVNPGGPGGSGTYFVGLMGAALATMLKGQYDIIGFDPRGVGSSRPYVSCFETAFDEEVFANTAALDLLNLPANLTAFEFLHADLSRQVELQAAGLLSVAKQCLKRSGEILPYLGTENVVKDIDYLARAIEGDDKPINFWGFSYGTVIGQYMVKILPPKRLGRIVIDGVVNPVHWAQDALRFFDNDAIQDMDNILLSFSSSCLDAGPNCTLNADSTFDSPSALLSKLDATIDMLYAHPVPVYNHRVPAVATAKNIRYLLFFSMYSIQSWPKLAEILQQTFKGNFTDLVHVTAHPIRVEDAHKPDSSMLSIQAIYCADVPPYTNMNPLPTTAEVADSILDKLRTSSSQVGEVVWGILCHKWAEAGLSPTQSRYDGDFDLVDDTLETPVLILTNTYDHVTPLASAIMANNRLGNNARLIQQLGGLGHSTLSHVSYCTLRAFREYMLEGKVPENKHSTCKVDQKPFTPISQTVIGFSESEAELLEAASKASEALLPLKIIGRAG